MNFMAVGILQMKQPKTLLLILKTQEQQTDNLKRYEKIAFGHQYRYFFIQKRFEFSFSYSKH